MKSGRKLGARVGFNCFGASKLAGRPARRQLSPSQLGGAAELVAKPAPRPHRPGRYTPGARKLAALLRETAGRPAKNGLAAFNFDLKLASFKSAAAQTKQIRQLELLEPVNETRHMLAGPAKVARRIQLQPPGGRAGSAWLSGLGLALSSRLGSAWSAWLGSLGAEAAAARSGT